MMPGIRRILGVFLFAAAFLVAAAVPAHAGQDQVQFFHNIEITPDTPAHDAVCFFCNVHADGEVMGDIVVFFGSVRLNGHAHHDVVNFFGHITAADNSSIGGDAVSFFGGVRLGENAHVAKDVVCIFGSAHVPPSASIGGDRVGIPGLILYGPAIVIFLIVWVIVREVRCSRRRRWMASYYPYPPQR
jgi:hypothetical protein